jgi:flagellar assembly protein FliH
LSNIIKLSDTDAGVSVTAFNFQKLPRPVRKCFSNVLSKDQAEHECPSDEEIPVDPEAALRNRLLDAERKAEQMEKEAYEKAYAQGRKDGFEYGRKHMAIVQSQLENLIEDLDALPSKLLADYRDWIVDTCLKIARQIVRRELETDHNQLIHLIDTILKETSEKYTLTVHLNPADHELLKKHMDPVRFSEQTGRKVDLKPDPEVQRGGCWLENEIERVDATIEKQFALVELALGNSGSEADDAPAA